MKKKTEVYILFKKMKHSRLFKNMSWLFILNFSNKIIPFFTFPYITRIFQAEGFGIISFSLAFIAYFQVFIDYGFNLTGAKKVATAEHDSRELSKVYSTIITTKFLFFLISLPIIIFVTIFNDALFEYKEIIFTFILLALSNVLMPTWLFQGLQKVKNMTVISLVIRILFLISVFTLVKSINDLLLYALLYSSSFLIIAIVSSWHIHIHMGIRFCKVRFKFVIEMIIEGYYVFTSSAVIAVMGSTGIFVLGMFYTVEYSGYYSGISKINQIIVMFFYPIGLALFPYHSKKYRLSFTSGYNSVVKVSKIILPAFLIISMCIIFLREQIVWLILGEDFLSMANLIIVMAFIPFLSIVSNLLGTQILVASGYAKEYSKAFLKSALLSIILYFVLGYYFAIWGVVIATVAGEIISLHFLYIEVKKVKKIEKGSIN